MFCFSKASVYFLNDCFLGPFWDWLCTIPNPSESLSSLLVAFCKQQTSHLHDSLRPGVVRDVTSSSVAIESGLPSSIPINTTSLPRCHAHLTRITRGSKKNNAKQWAFPPGINLIALNLLFYLHCRFGGEVLFQGMQPGWNLREHPG